jgi:hypothetical protein
VNAPGYRTFENADRCNAAGTVEFATWMQFALKVYLGRSKYANA